MNREYKKKLRSALNKLPQHSPDPEVWERIEGQLTFNEQLTFGSQNLPIHEPDEKVWRSIEKQLDHKKIRKIIPVTIRYLSVAACIAAIIITTLTITRNHKEILTKSVEISDNNLQIPTDESDKLTDKAISFLDDQCKSSNYLCEMPEFREKHQKLIEVNSELKIMNKEMESLGSSPTMLQTKTKLENLKAQLIKELVKQVTS